jgi:hypothetical protein
MAHAYWILAARGGAGARFVRQQVTASMERPDVGRPNVAHAALAATAVVHAALAAVAAAARKEHARVCPGPGPFLAPPFHHVPHPFHFARYNVQGESER